MQRSLVRAVSFLPPLPFCVIVTLRRPVPSRLFRLKRFTALQLRGMSFPEVTQHKIHPSRQSAQLLATYSFDATQRVSWKGWPLVSRQRSTSLVDNGVAHEFPPELGVNGRKQVAAGLKSICRAAVSSSSVCAIRGPLPRRASKY